MVQIEIVKKMKFWQVWVTFPLHMAGQFATKQEAQEYAKVLEFYKETQ